jgi:hypothetical protein
MVGVDPRRDEPGRALRIAAHVEDDGWGETFFEETPS